MLLFYALNVSIASVGMYAIQLAHLAGYKVATVSSPKHHELLKSYGADVIFDVRVLLNSIGEYVMLINNLV